MAYDPVFDRQMFQPKSSKGKGIVALADDNADTSDLDARRQRAMEMLAQARHEQDPANFQMLSDRERPMVFRPTAVNLPQPQQQPPVAQQMAQMQAAGLHPVGLAHGGIAHFAEGGPSWVERFGSYVKAPSDYIRRKLGLSDSPEPSSEPATVSPTVSAPDDGVPRDENGYVVLSDPEHSWVDWAGEKAIEMAPFLSGIKRLGGKKAKPMEPKVKAKPAEGIETLPKPGEPEFVGPTKEPYGPYEQGSSGVPSVPARKPTMPKMPVTPDRVKALTAVGDPMDVPKFNRDLSYLPIEKPAPGTPAAEPKPVAKPAAKSEEDGTEKHPTNLQDIKDNNFNLALIRAGLGMAAGKSSNPLTNIAEGGIQGLEQYTSQAARDRAMALEQKKLDLQEKHYNTLLKRSDIANTLAQNRLAAMQGHLYQTAITKASEEAEKKKAAGDFPAAPGSKDMFDKGAYDMFYRSKVNEYLRGLSMGSEFNSAGSGSDNTIDTSGSMADLLGG